VGMEGGQMVLQTFEYLTKLTFKIRICLTLKQKHERYVAITKLTFRK